MKNKYIKIFDTTLRDGEQAPGNSMTKQQKIDLFKKIDAIGVDYIEVGFPASSVCDFEVIQQLCQQPHKATIVAFARPTKEDIDCAAAAFANDKNVQLQLLFVGSELHLLHKRRMSLNSCLEEIRTSINYSRDLGIRNISMGLEDATRGTTGYLQNIIKVGIEYGANSIVIADTVGTAIPEEMAKLVKKVKSWVTNDITVSVHCHNDLGLATANALAAVHAGADCIQTTLCGIGERAGNTALEEIATILFYKSQHYKTNTRIKFKLMQEACQELINIINLKLSDNKPLLGKYVFTTAAGIHINGMLKNPVVYQYVDPALFGKRAEFLISRHSGRSVVRERIKEMGLLTNESVVEKMYEHIMSSDDIAKYNENSHLKKLYFEITENPKLCA